ncbi:MAG: carbohydrate ABC transporter permease [Paracoccaceae bacterium]
MSLLSKDRRSLGLAYAILTLAAFASIFPILWIIGISLKTQVDAFAMPPKWLFTPIWDNYAKVWATSGFVKAFFNSVWVSLASNLLAFAIGIPAAYALNRRHVPGRAVILAWLLLSYMLPEFLYVIPVYGVFQQIGLYDNVFGLALIYQAFTLPFTIWMMRAFFAEVPYALTEAAMLEGAGKWRILWTIYVPIAAPGIAATAILNTIKIWNELAIALGLTFDKAQTITLAVAGFRGYASIDWGAMSAAAIIEILPMLAFAVLAQRQIVGGLSVGAVK